VFSLFTIIHVRAGTKRYTDALLVALWFRKVPKHIKTGAAPHLTMDW